VSKAFSSALSSTDSSHPRPQTQKLDTNLLLVLFPRTGVSSKISLQHIKQFQERVFAFYSEYGRTLPWRQTTDPYRVLVSEVMLQQTQVSRVIPYYESWIQTWPTIRRLAQANRQDVLRAWMGLGYNRRAVNLHRSAQIICECFHDDILQAMHEHPKVPGVGEYTAQAVLIFSTNEDLVTIDTNIRRILIAEFQLPETTTKNDLWELARRCLPAGRSREWHNALMDYGALLVTARKTGIAPLTRQTRFEGSDRQIRAKILKALLDKPATLSTLTLACKVPEERIHPILVAMGKEGLIISCDGEFRVSTK
jgi:A/G-specific adenine glycosylase